MTHTSSVDAKMLSLCSGVPTWTTTGCVYAIGDTGPAGGIVFHITDGGLHGLEAAPADQSGYGEWGCVGVVIGTTAGSGAQNTANILAGCSVLGIAARLADDYTLNGFANWFLPSYDELNLLYQQKAVVGGFARDFYWSSTEFDSDNAWYQSFSNGNKYAGPKHYTLGVRAVRAF